MCATRYRQMVVAARARQGRGKGAARARQGRGKGATEGTDLREEVENRTRTFQGTISEAQPLPAARRIGLCIATDTGRKRSATDADCGSHRYASVGDDVTASSAARPDVERLLSAIANGVAGSEQIQVSEWSARAGLLATAG